MNGEINDVDRIWYRNVGVPVILFMMVTMMNFPFSVLGEVLKQKCNRKLYRKKQIIQ
jgi:hypothetical protein